MRILYITTVSGMMGFFKDLIHTLIEEGNTVDLATNNSSGNLPPCYREWGCKVYPLSCTRSPLDRGNLRAIREIRKIVTDGDYDLVHCHSPIAAMCTRVACWPLRKNGLKVFYTAHGFHFWKGAPLKNWLLYYPAEWLCAHWTDTLITINEEDYALAQKHMHAKRVEYVPGVGINLEGFAPAKMNEEKKHAKRAELGLDEEDKLLLSVGMLQRDKNHMLVLKAMTEAPELGYKYRVCGTGQMKEPYERYIAENHLTGRAALLGYRNDIAELLQITDLFVFPSEVEGLPVSVMEAIASKVMVVCSASRGNTDLVKDKRCLFDYRSVGGLLQAIQNVENMSEEERNEILEDNYSRLLPREKSAVIARMEEIYEEAGKG